MLKNYLKVTLRNIRSNKVYSLINIFGLAAGITICMLITLYIHNDLSFDKFNKNYNRIYRINQEFMKDGGNVNWTLTPSGFHNAFINDFPGVLSARMVPPDFYQPVVKYKENLFTSKHFIFSDPEIFDIFSLHLIIGNPKTALNQPFSVVISRTEASKIFGNVNPLGKIIRVNNLFDYKVTGVAENMPANSTIQFNYLAPFNNIKDVLRREFHWDLSDNDVFNNFNASNFYTFVLLPNDKDKEKITKQLPSLLDKYCGTETSKYCRLHLQQLGDIHFGTGLQFDYPNKGNLSTDYILSAIAFFILFIGCINFINISTAHTVKRAKEIGLRKVFGAFRIKIIWQFITEHIILTFISIILAAALFILSLPYFNEITGKHLSTTGFLNPGMIAVFFTAWLFIIFAVCAYPAVYLSSFRPAAIFRGGFKNGRGSGFLKKGLIVFQFVISIALIAITIAVTKQYDFMKSFNPGFNKDQVIYLPVNSEITKNYDSFRTQLLQRPDVSFISRTNWIPGDPHNIESYSWAGKNGVRHESFYSLIVDYGFAQALGLKFISGKGFSRERAAESDGSYIINETAAERTGWSSETAVGKYIQSGYHGNKRVAGVVKDFNIESLRSNVQPVIMVMGKPDQFLKVVVKIKSNNIAQTLSAIGSSWENAAPDFPFDYHFIDKDFENLYISESRLSEIISIFSGLSVLIACLGLLGLISHSARERTKEIGIRKVLGASVSRVVYLLIKEYASLILIANLIAIPAAYYFIRNWLGDFAYKTDISAWIFIASGIVALLIALATVIIQSVKAASANPIESLRYE